METATSPVKHHAHGAEPGHGDVAPIDPDHDIDPRKTVIALATVSVGLVVTIWLLFQLFSFVIFQERTTKVEGAPTTALDQLRAEEAKLLQAGDGRISIEDSIRELAEKAK